MPSSVRPLVWLPEMWPKGGVGGETGPIFCKQDDLVKPTHLLSIFMYLIVRAYLAALSKGYPFPV